MSKGRPTPKAPQNRQSPALGVQIVTLVAGLEAGVVDSPRGPLHSLLFDVPGPGRVDLRYPIEQAPMVADAIMESYNAWKAKSGNGDRLEVVRHGLVLPPGAGG